MFAKQNSVQLFNFPNSLCSNAQNFRFLVRCTLGTETMFKTYLFICLNYV